MLTAGSLGGAGGQIVLDQAQLQVLNLSGATTTTYAGQIHGAGGGLLFNSPGATLNLTGESDDTGATQIIGGLVCWSMGSSARPP
jgi:hypothetical protein